MRFAPYPPLHGLLALGACAFASAAFSQTPAPAATGAQATSTPYAVGAQRSGISKCVARINQVTGFVTGNNANSGMVLTSGNKDANTNITSSVIEVEGGGTTSFVSTSFAPGPGSADCSGTYDAVVYWATSCAQVATTNFGTFKPSPRPLLKAVNMLDGGPFVKVFLMPAGTGCVSIKKEMVF
jgi:hypothetical protein